MAFTFFFRDITALNAIKDHVIPELRKQRYINVWDAGCAMGPEPYSIAIIFKETLGYYEFKRFRIYATDLDEESNEFGKILAKGIYPEEAVKRIPGDIFRKYFSSNNKPEYFKIADEIMQCVCFQKHDLRSLQPIRDNFGLIVCKNVRYQDVSQIPCTGRFLCDRADTKNNRRSCRVVRAGDTECATV